MASKGPPKPPSESDRRRLAAQARADTKPEVALRKLLHARGYRFRVHYPIEGTRRTIDIAFTRRRVAVFVDGCFWHGCPEHGTMPKSNSRWWAEKIASNRKRDRDTDDILERSGWTVVRIWEHDAPATASLRVARVLSKPVTA